MKPHTFGFIALIALAAVAVGLFGQKKHEPNVVFTAFGSSWYLQDAEWELVEGVWRVSGTVRPKRVTKKINGHIVGLAYNMCDGILAAMAGGPQGAGRMDVFRVSLHFANANGEKYTQHKTPVPVRNGECLVPEGNAIFPAYTNVLGDWVLDGMLFEKQRGRVLAIFNFKPLNLVGEVKGETALFTDYELACRLAIADAVSGEVVKSEMILEGIERANNLVAVRVSRSTLGGVLGTYQQSGWMKVTEDGECLPVAPEVEGA